MDDVVDEARLVTEPIDDVAGDVLTLQDREDGVVAPGGGRPGLLVPPVEEVGASLAGRSLMIPSDLPQAHEPVVEDIGLIDGEALRAPVEPLARNDRHDRTGCARGKAREARAAGVAVHKWSRSQELDETRDPSDVRVAGTTD